jgi:hypothetical protein
MINIIIIIKNQTKTGVYQIEKKRQSVDYENKTS